MIMTDLLQANAMLVALNISCAGFTRKDPKVTAQVNRDHAATANAGKYDKNLLDPRMVEGPQRAARAARGDHERLTLPWDKAYRLLPVELFDKYVETMAEHKVRFDETVTDLADKLPALIEQRRQQLNGMFNEADYDQYRDLESLYDFKRSVRDVPTGANFYAQIVDDQAATIRAEIDKENADLLRNATEHTFQKLHAVICKIAYRLDGYEAVEVRKAGGKKKIETTRHGKPTKIYDSMIGNLADLVEILPALNVSGDAQLAALVDEIRDSELLKYNADDFRDPANKAVVETVQTQADDISERLAGFFGGEQ